jgi:hypothetical protein
MFPVEVLDGGRYLCIFLASRLKKVCESFLLLFSRVVSSFVH